MEVVLLYPELTMHRRLRQQICQHRQTLQNYNKVSKANKGREVGLQEQQMSFGTYAQAGGIGVSLKLQDQGRGHF